MRHITSIASRDEDGELTFHRNPNLIDDVLRSLTDQWFQQRCEENGGKLAIVWNNDAAYLNSELDSGWELMEFCGRSRTWVAVARTTGTTGSVIAAMAVPVSIGIALEMGLSMLLMLVCKLL